MILFSDYKSSYLLVVKLQTATCGGFKPSDCSVMRLKERLRNNGNWGNKFGAVVSN